MLNIKWKRITEFGIIPSKATEVASGWDFYSPHDFKLEAGERAILPTDIALQMSIDGNENINFIPWMKLEGCSGNAAKKGIVILGGVIDNDFQLGIKVIMLNSSSDDIIVNRGNKLCQGVVHLCYKNNSINETIVEEFDNISERTEKNLSGFGSTGVIGDATKINS